MVWLLLGIPVLAFAAFIIILRKAGGGKFPWIQFFTKGKESGFSFGEINLLRKVAVENRLENPTSLFWSIKQLDRSIKGTIIKARAENIEHTPYMEQFLAHLFDFRKRVEMDLPKYKLGIKSTRKVVNHQRLKLSVAGVGTFNSQVVENLRRYMAISYPEGKKMPEGFNWKGQKVNIYFWRAEDAGYTFQTKVLEDFYEQQFPILHIAHTENIIRSQKRGSIRVNLSHPAQLYPLGNIQVTDEDEESMPGLRCRLKDLSEDGAAVLVGGRAKVGMAAKLQFHLGDASVRMSGVVKGVTYDTKKNHSVLHIQAAPMSNYMRNSILTYVYNIFGDRSSKKRRGIAVS